MTLTYGLVSTYPPTACGLATFTASLAGELAGPRRRGSRCRIVRAVDAPNEPAPGVAADLVAGSATSRSHAIGLLNDTDVAIVQHEYGIFGGPDGDEIVALVEAITVPVIVVLHTVLRDPTPHQREVLERVAAAADAVVTMTNTARRRLQSGYVVDMAKVATIPHGAHVAPPSPPQTTIGLRPTILTWGLIGPGKGVEWGIEAMALLPDVGPRPRYLIVGKTHPKVLDAQGESYRMDLKRRAKALGVGADVEFDATYVDVPSLQTIVSQATMVLLPYDSPDQITSGVLIEAIAAGKPVVSTRFPHAVELLSGGVGLLVPHRDPAAIATAIHSVLTDESLRQAMTAAAERLAPALAWGTVADSYRALAMQLIGDHASAVA